MKPLLLVASNKSASDLMKCGDYRVVGYSNLMANFSGLTLVTQSKLVSRLWYENFFKCQLNFYLFNKN